MLKEHEYDIAVSFAGEDRELVNEISMELKRRGISVFYDLLEQHKLWGKDLYQYLADVYSNKSKYCIVFASEHYKNKSWTKHELMNAQSRAFSQDIEYILPIKIDDTELPGLPSTIGYLDSRKLTANEIIELIIKKLGHVEAEHIKSEHPIIGKESSVYWKVNSVINANDPIGLLPMAPADEYSIEVNEIMKNLHKYNDRRELADYIHSVFVRYFSTSVAGDISGYMNIAEQILEIL